MRRMGWALWISATMFGCLGSAPSTEGTAPAAVVSNVVSMTATLTGTTLTVRSGDMPLGWFTRHGGFDATKSPVTLTVHLDATACSPAYDLTLTGADGTYTPLLNPAGHPRGYTWSATVDLALQADHWHNHVLCDGTVQVEGCAAARTAAVTLNVGGACLEDTGSCTATSSFSLPSVQDPDVVDTNCGTATCDIGPCVSACQAACTNGDSACGQCCECRCKAEGRAAGNLACRPQSLCYKGSPGHAACLAGP